MINIFLDSNALYSDPTMIKGHNRKFFEKINSINGNIYICDVVYKEIINNYKKQLNTIVLDISKSKSNLKKLNIDIENINIDVEEKLNEIKSTIDKYIKDKKLIKLETDNSVLSEVIDRSINRKKPFSENKEEFRDCIIWLTYANAVENNDLDNCILITRNKSDFCNKEGTLHDDLLSDTKRFKVYKDIYTFLKSESELIEKLEYDILPKIETSIKCKTKDYKIEECEFNKENIFNNIYDEVYSYLIGLHEEEIIELFHPVYIENIEAHGMDIISIDKNNTDVDLRNSNIIESGNILIDASADLTVYFDEEYISIGSAEITLNASYLATIKIKNINPLELDKSISKIEIDNMKVINIMSDVFNDYYEDMEFTAMSDAMEALENYHNH